MDAKLINSLLIGDDRADVFLTGRCGVGKTSIAQEMQKLAPDLVYSISPGRACRKHFGEQFFANLDNTVAPKESEEFVRQFVADAVSQKDTQLNVIDGFPRSPEQVRWAMKISDNPIFVCITCNELTRLERLKNRDSSPAAMTLNTRRNEDESKFLLYTLEEISVNGGKLRFYDNTTDDDTLISWSDDFDFVKPRNIDVLFREIDKLSEMTMKRWYTSPLILHNQARRRANQAESTDLCVEWIRRFALDMRGEVEELIAELPIGWRDTKTVDLSRLRVELVDIAHFLISAVHASGLTAKEFFELVKAKRDINIHRFLYGKKAGDDAHLGIIKKINYVVYLAGPITGATSDFMGYTWRDVLEKELGDKYTFLNPIKRRIEEFGSADAVADNMHKVIERDLEDIASSDVVVFYAPTGSAGSAMEEFFAKRITNTPVVFVIPETKLHETSKWLYDHANQVISLTINANQIKDDLVFRVEDALRHYDV